MYSYKNCTVTKKFDFTESETKVYMALLQNGIMIDYETAKVSGVARSKVYGVLNSLLHEGVSTVNSQENFSWYQAESSEYFVNLLRIETETALQDIANQTKLYETKKTVNKCGQW